jgi:putative membrane protein
MKKAILLGTVVLGFAAAPVFAGQETTRPTKAPATMNDKTANKSGVGDHAWVTKVAEGGMAEVDLGKLAAEKASSDEVKKFGQRMVDDHSKANDELKSLAQKKNITLPSDLDAKHKAEHDRLAKLSGAAFDRAYMRSMLADHRKDVAEFRTEANSGKDPDVKAFAAKTLPTLEDHLKTAEQTSKTVGSVATSGTLGKSKTKK